MAVDYKELYREQEWSTDEKRALARVFALAEVAAAPSVSATISEKVVHKELGGKLAADETHDLQKVFEGLRAAIDADNASYDIAPHFRAHRWNGNKERVVRAMANAVIAQVSAT